MSKFSHLTVLIEKYYISIFFTSVVIGMAFNQRIAGPLSIFFAALALLISQLSSSYGNNSLFENITPNRKNHWLLMMLALLAWSFCSMLWGIGGIEVYDRPIKQAAYLLSAVILFNFVARRTQEFQPETGIVLLIVFAFLADHQFFGFLNKFHKSANVAVYFNRINVTVVLLALSIAGIVIARSKNKSRILILLACLAVSTGYFSSKSYSQTSILAWLVGWSTLIASFYLNKTFRNTILAVLGFTPVIVVTGVYFGSDLLVNLTSLDLKVIQESYSGIRLGIWQETIKLALENSVIGQGNNALYIITKAQPLDNDLFGGQIISVTHPHNAFLQIWIEFGLVGLALATGALVAISMAIARIPEPAVAPVMALYATILTISSVSHGAWQSWWLGTLVLVATITTALITNKKAN